MNCKSLRRLYTGCSKTTSLLELRNLHLDTGSQNGIIKIWKIESGMCIYILSGHEAPIKSLVETETGILISGTGGLVQCQIKLWDLKCCLKSCILTIPTQFNEFLFCLNNQFIVGIGGSNLSICSLKTGAEVKNISIENMYDKMQLRGLYMLPEKNSVVALVNTLSMTLDKASRTSATFFEWELTNCILVNSIKAHIGRCAKSIKVSDKVIVSAGYEDGYIKVWETSKWFCSRVISTLCQNLRIISNNKTDCILTTSKSQRIHIWNLNRAQQTKK